MRALGGWRRLTADEVVLQPSGELGTLDNRNSRRRAERDLGRVRNKLLLLMVVFIRLESVLSAVERDSG